MNMAFILVLLRRLAVALLGKKFLLLAVDVITEQTEAKWDDQAAKLLRGLLEDDTLAIQESAGQLLEAATIRLQQELEEKKNG